MIGRGLLDIASRRIDPFVGATIWDLCDWDICCVLDGCRVDTFRSLRDDAHAYWSVASTSQDWLARTFDGRDLSAVAYVTGNPYAPELDTDAFAHFHHAPVRGVEGIETVPPDVLADRAIEAWRRRDALGIDRLVVHFMQPHVPFRGKAEWFQDYYGTDTWGSSIWHDVGETIDRQDWLWAYRDNLAWALVDGVGRLAGNADATIGVTADHGNAAGEWGYWGHPGGCLHPAVRKVPWLTVEGTDRATVEPETPSAGDVDPQQQLEALGYV